MTIKKVELKVAGMQCTGCEQSIEDAILILPGIVKVKANYVEKTVIIDFDIGNIRMLLDKTVR